MESTGGFSTKCVHSGTIHMNEQKGTNTPINTSTAFHYLDRVDTAYPRYFNVPNQHVVAKKIATLEGAQAGLVFSSGMAAVFTTLFTFLRQGDHAIFQKGLYGGTFNLITKEFNRLGIDYTILRENSPAAFLDALQSNTRLIYIETPSNPLLSLVDIQRIASIACEHKLASIIDNTFATPMNQNPIALGMDVVIHSATKYLGGHSDICAGAVVSSHDLIQKIHEKAINFGGSLDASTCYLLERSIKTLELRVRQQNLNAMALAVFLDERVEIKQVYYPGLPGHENHQIAKKQMRGYGGMLSFELDELDSTRFQRNLKLIQPTVSLGGVDSIICSPALTSHRHLTPAERQEQGITDGLLRLSVGIEDVEDLKNDILQALKE